MTNFIIVFFASVAGYYSSMLVVARAAIEANSYGEMISGVKSSVIAMCVAVALSFIVFGYAASVFLAFCLCHAIALCRMDYDAAYKVFKDL